MDHVIGMCLIDDGRDIDVETFALRISCKNAIALANRASRYSSALLLSGCENAVETSVSRNGRGCDM